MSQQNDSRARWRFQFSLATLFVLFTIAAVLIAGWMASRKLNDTTVELQKYRNEAGELTITDRQRVHAIGVQVTGSLEWKWRVYLPERRQFRFHLVTGEVPKTVAPGPGEAMGVSTHLYRSGEFPILARVEKNHRGDWVFAASTPEGKCSSPIQNDAWLERGGWEISAIEPGKTQSVALGEPMVLLRLRVDQSGSPPQSPCDGLMVLIEEIKGE